MYIYNNLSKDLAIWLLYALLAVSVISAGSTVLEISLLSRIQSGDFVSVETITAEAEGSDTRQQILAYTYLALYAASGLASLIWTFRASRNAAVLSVLPQQYRPGWAVGWYFVPIANLWKPYDSMKEIWRRSAWPPQEGLPPVLGQWWLMWIAGNILGQIALRLSLNAEGVDQMLVASSLNLASDLIDIPLVLAYAHIIRRITAMQAAKHAANPDRPADSFVDVPDASDESGSTPGAEEPT